MKTVKALVLGTLGAAMLAMPVMAAQVIMSGPHATNVREGEAVECYPADGGWLKCYQGGILKGHVPQGEPMGVVPSGTLKSDKDGDIDLYCVKKSSGKVWCHTTAGDEEGEK